MKRFILKSLFATASLGLAITSARADDAVAPYGKIDDFIHVWAKVARAKTQPLLYGPYNRQFGYFSSTRLGTIENVLRDTLQNPEIVATIDSVKVSTASNDGTQWVDVTFHTPDGDTGSASLIDFAHSEEHVVFNQAQMPCDTTFEVKNKRGKLIYSNYLGDDVCRSACGG